MILDDEHETRAAIEAVIMATVEPVPPELLAQLVELPHNHVEEICDELVAEYEHEGRGFTLGRHRRRLPLPDALGPRIRTSNGSCSKARPPGSPVLRWRRSRSWRTNSRSRAQLSAIRGVNVDATLKRSSRGYVEEVGHEPTPGNPVLFGTTTTFLERLGLDSLDQLPALGDFVPDASVVEALEHGLRFRDNIPMEVEADAEADAEVDARAVTETAADPDPAEITTELQSGLDGE